jgi:hypothetical protein
MHASTRRRFLATMAAAKDRQRTDADYAHGASEHPVQYRGRLGMAIRIDCRPDFRIKLSAAFMG